MSHWSPPVFSCQRQAQALAYWQSKRVNGAIPSYKAFDPVDIPELLPFVVVLDVIREPLDFRYRLIGDEVRIHMDRNLVGLGMREAGLQTEEGPIFRHAREVAENGEPRYYAVDCVAFGRYQVCQQGLSLPFTVNGEQVDKLISILSYRRDATPLPDRAMLA